MRGLIVGYGSIGKRHAENLNSLDPGIELFVLRKNIRLETTVGTIVRNLDEAIRFGLDFAVIATPSTQHVDTLLPLLEAQIACYVEKPVVTSRRDLSRLRSLLEKHTKIPITLVGCNLRFLPSLQLLRRLITEGRIGQVVRASFQAGQWLPEWRPSQDYRLSYSADSALGGGVIFDLIHEIDMARWLFGDFDVVKAVSGRFSRLDITSEDSACLLLAKKNEGPLISIGLDYVARHRIRRYEVVGDQGTLSWDLSTQRLELATERGTESMNAGSDGFDMANTYLVAMSEFLHCVESQCVSSQDISEGLKSTELAMLARESAGLCAQ